MTNKQSIYLIIHDNYNTDNIEIKRSLINKPIFNISILNNL